VCPPGTNAAPDGELCVETPDAGDGDAGTHDAGFRDSGFHDVGTDVLDAADATSGDAGCSLESCNGRDDDCDGEVDEDAAETCGDTHVHACLAGSCLVVVCDSPLGACEGRELCDTNLLESEDHCGLCGAACDDCVDGTCEGRSVQTLEASVLQDGTPVASDVRVMGAHPPIVASTLGDGSFILEVPRTSAPVWFRVEPEFGRATLRYLYPTADEFDYTVLVLDPRILGDWEFFAETTQRSGLGTLGISAIATTPVEVTIDRDVPGYQITSEGDANENTIVSDATTGELFWLNVLPGPLTVSGEGCNLDEREPYVLADTHTILRLTCP